jgi:hypothetical protein
MFWCSLLLDDFLQVFIEEPCKLAPRIFRCQGVVRRTLVAEKPVVGITVNLQGILFVEFLEPGFDLSNTFLRNEWIDTTEE